MIDTYQYFQIQPNTQLFLFDGNRLKPTDTPGQVRILILLKESLIHIFFYLRIIFFRLNWVAWYGKLDFPADLRQVLSTQRIPEVKVIQRMSSISQQPPMQYFTPPQLSAS
ncbi:MAG: hypothetical protein EZS28_046486, partial [Streblomastix strix]